MRLDVNNSFCKFSDDIPAQTSDLVSRVLTYQNDIEAEKGSLFYRMKMLKQYGPKKKPNESDQEREARGRKTMGLYQKQLKELEASEWVCWFKNNSFPTGHLNIVKAVLEQSNTQYELVDHRNVPQRDMILKWYNRPFEPRYYQKEMIDLGLKVGRGVFESAVGTGKSLIMGYIVKQLAVNSLVVVPSRGLSSQLYNDFSLWFGSHNVEIMDTKSVRSGKALKPIRIITVQSLASLQKSGEIQKLVGDVKALHIDEIHHAGASSYTNLLPELDHIYYRFGYTGTFLRNDSKSLDMWGFLSNVLYKYPAKKAIADGFLTPLTVLVHTVEGKKAMKYQKEYDNCYCGNPHLLNRLTEIVSAKESHEQMLTLVNKKDKGGKIIHEYFNNYGIANSYISGDDDRDHITQTISNFNSKKINNMIGSSVIGEGIDVRAAHHMAMCQGGKSEIVITQATGRLVRLDDGKHMAYLHDFKFPGTKFMGKHLDQRLEIYVRNFGAEIKYV